MCAIAGSIGKSINISRFNIKELDESLSHRGPDFQSYFLRKELFFYHARLSIIDLRKVSNQPMFSADKKTLIIFNGEIYNYIELKKKIKNYKFKTKSDTEVILAAYKKWGKKCLHKLAGAFAFIIYDFEKKEAFFARDRFGQKPFFFHRFNNQFNFASEIKGLIALGLNPKVNKKIWHNYLINGVTDENEDTFFLNAKQLLPGHYGVLNSKNQLRIFQWYNLKEKIKKNQNEKIKNIKENIFHHLNNSIEICSRADVPISIALSGGLDSSILFSMHNKYNYLNKSPDAYSIEFENDLSEKDNINLTTSAYQKKSNFINFTSDDWISSINPSLWYLESPSGGLMSCAYSKMNYRIKKEGFKIVQDATGLDEIFGGYDLHHLIYLKNLHRKSQKEFDKNLKMFCKNTNQNVKTVSNKINLLFNNSPKTIDAHNLVKRNLFNKDFYSYGEKLIDEQKNVKTSLINFMQKSKIPRNNRLKDRMSMAFGLELRLPFLEHNLVEYGLSLNNRYYFMEGHSKSILRETVKGILNDEIRLDRKLSLQSPQNNWFKKKNFIQYFEKIIQSESFKSRGYYNIEKVNKLWREYLIKKNNNTSFFLWQIINCEIWHRLFIDNNPIENIHNFNYR